MNKLLLLLTLCALGCDTTGPELVDVSLRDLPHFPLQIHRDYDGNGMYVHITPKQYPYQGGPCYRLPDGIQLTANGRALRLASRGGFSNRTLLNPDVYCKIPYFRGDALPDEPLTEFILSDGQTQRRAVFQNLLAVRGFRVNGQEQATVRSGQELDLEWFPATDRLESMDIRLWQQGTGYVNVQKTSERREGNHLYSTFAPVSAGRYMLVTLGDVQPGVETCEGFSTCEATNVLSYLREIEVPLTIE